jgi:ABC-2 type transport system ATP-binding protein
MDETAIKVESVSKLFKLPHEKQSSIKSAFVNLFRSKKGYELQKALDDISFEVKKGEFFGIVGRNGSGKSTLLKLLAGIYNPTAGHIQVNGKLTPFIELGVGFNPELTGRENVFLNGALLGFNRKDMKAMYQDVVSFAELERFMDQKLKNYSSGMQVRLAFSIAIRAQSDILLIDEVLAVGDAAFQRKCFSYFGDLKKNKQTVIFVSHDMASVRKYCDRAILINEGSITAEGMPSEVVPEYLKIFMDEAARDKDVEAEAAQDLPFGMSEMIDIDKSVAKIDKAWIENQAGKKIKNIGEKDKHFMIKFKVHPLKDVDKVVPGVIITNEQGEFITASNSIWRNHQDINMRAGSDILVSFKLPNIYEKGDYKVSINLVSGDLSTFYAWKNEVYKLQIDKEYITGAKSNPAYEVKVISDGK